MTYRIVERRGQRWEVEVQREPGGVGTPICWCATPDDERHILRALVRGVRG